jgi:hypothetical protein
MFDKSKKRLDSFSKRFWLYLIQADSSQSFSVSLHPMMLFRLLDIRYG